jgi:hypothetical protein
MHDPLHRLYRAKLTVLALGLFFVGLGLLVFGHWIQSEPDWHWLHNWPLIDIGSGMFTTGLLGVALQYIDGADSEARDTARLKRVLTDSTPAMRDAVIAGFAFEPEDLARVATTDVLDKIITNGLGIRLRDRTFADEVFEDMKRQIIEPPERLHDARISIRLSTDRLGPSRVPRSTFMVTIRWEFRVKPFYSTRRFVCLADFDEYRDLKHDTTATSAWYVGTRTGLDAAAKGTFELVDFTVNGEPRPIRRSTKQGSQSYSVALGEEAMQSAEPVNIAYTYRTLVAANGHLLQLRVDQPTKGLAVSLDYSETDIDYVNVLDFIASGEHAIVSRTSALLPGKSVELDFDGWVFPRSGLAFVWDNSEAAVSGRLPSQR